MNALAHQTVKVDIKKEQRTSAPAMLFGCKCPRCRIGNMFVTPNPWNLKSTMKMNKQCSVCNQPFDIEVGFYFGSSYVSYAFAVALSVMTFVAWWVIIGFSYHDNRFFHWLLFNCISLLLMQPYLMRIARTGWLSFFVRYDRNWRVNEPNPLERTNILHENDW